MSAQASAETREAAAERGTDFLAAPVSGNPKVVSAGLLTLAVSGSRPVFDAALPLLSLLERTGPVGIALTKRVGCVFCSAAP